jgi:hypothetical protein
MIDPGSGAIRFEDPKWNIDPALTRSQFLASDAGRRAAVHVRNEPHCSWALRDVQRARCAFHVALFFQGERLEMVQLVGDEPPFSWESQSDETEQIRKKGHDAWLAASLGAQRRFPWGEVWSEYDPRSGFSSVIVRYLRRGGR